MKVSFHSKAAKASPNHRVTSQSPLGQNMLSQFAHRYVTVQLVTFSCELGNTLDMRWHTMTESVAPGSEVGRGASTVPVHAAPLTPTTSTPCDLWYIHHFYSVSWGRRAPRAVRSSRAVRRGRSFPQSLRFMDKYGPAVEHVETDLDGTDYVMAAVGPVELIGLSQAPPRSR